MTWRDEAFGRARNVFMLGLAAGILVLAACSSTPKAEGGASPTTGASASIVGRYNCVHPDSTKGTAEIKANGTVTATSGNQTLELSWSLQGNRGAFTGAAEGGTRPVNDKFTFENGRIVFDEGSTCTRTS